MKHTLTAALAALALLSSASIGHCDLIKAGTTYHRDFLAYDASGNNLTSAAASTFTVQQSVAGGAPVTITPTITYKANGHFDLVYTSAIDSVAGSSALIITAPGATQVDINDQVVGFDPASDLGAATLLVLSKRTLNRQTYNPTTHVLQLLNDDGSAFGPSLTLTIDSNNNIVAR